MFVNNRYHSNSSVRLDIYKAKYAVCYTKYFNQDYVKFFNSLAQAYKFSLKVERARFFYRTDKNFNHWYSAGIAFCSKYGYVIFDDYNNDSPLIFED